MFALLAVTLSSPPPAAAPRPVTVWEKLDAVPRETWLSLLIVALVIWLLVRVWKSLREVNEIVPWIALVTIGGTVMLYWTYERTEPKILSPIFDQLSRVLPSKIEYKEKKPTQ
jgi:di/tricarboxylate transporter